MPSSTSSSFRIFLAFTLAFLALGLPLHAVDTCSNLTVAGETYILNQSVAKNFSTCFNVTAANITLDCQGKSISGNNYYPTYGIYSGQFNTTIKNCSISNFSYGIYFNAANNSTIQDTSTQGGAATYCGIALHASSNSTILNSAGVGLSGAGILLETGSNNNRVINSSGTDPSYAAIDIQSSSGNTISGSSGTSVSQSGIKLDTSPNSTITDSNGTSYSQQGIYVYSSSDSNITNSRGASNTSLGIRLERSSTNTIINSTATSVSSTAFQLTANSDRNTITNSEAISAQSIGMSLDTSSNTIANCRITGKHAIGALSLSGLFQDNLVANSTINGSAGAYAIYASRLAPDAPTNNSFINNTILNATTLLYLDSFSTSNTFCLNNFTNIGNNSSNAPLSYVTDSASANYYNCTYDSLNQGNIWANVQNGSVNVTGTQPSSLPGLYVGASGTGYPYNSTTSQGKVSSGVVDYAPLTSQSSSSGNISVLSSYGGAASGNATNFPVPSNRSVSATANAGYSFSTWGVVSGNCTIANASSSATTAQVNSGACTVQANFSAANMTIENAHISLTVDGTYRGAITSLYDKDKGVEYITANQTLKPSPIRVNLKNGYYDTTKAYLGYTYGGWDASCFSYSLQNSSSFSNISISDCSGTYGITANMTIYLNKSTSELSFTFDLRNNGSYIIQTAYYPVLYFSPMIGASADDDYFLLPYTNGRLYRNVDMLNTTWSYQSTYPGAISSQFMAFYDNSSGIYFQADDSNYYTKSIGMYRNNESGNNYAWFLMGHLTDESPGNNFTLPYHVIVRPFSGDWYDAADIYKNWSRSQWWVVNATNRADMPSELLNKTMSISVDTPPLPQTDYAFVASTISDKLRQGDYALTSSEFGGVYIFTMGGSGRPNTFWHGPTIYYPYGNATADVPINPDPSDPMYLQNAQLLQNGSSILPNILSGYRWDIWETNENGSVLYNMTADFNSLAASQVLVRENGSSYLPGRPIRGAVRQPPALGGDKHRLQHQQPVKRRHEIHRD